MGHFTRIGSGYFHWNQMMSQTRGRTPSGTENINIFNQYNQVPRYPAYNPYNSFYTATMLTGLLPGVFGFVGNLISTIYNWANPAPSQPAQAGAQGATNDNNKTSLENAFKTLGGDYTVIPGENGNYRVVGTDKDGNHVQYKGTMNEILEEAFPKHKNTKSTQSEETNHEPTQDEVKLNEIKAQITNLPGDAKAVVTGEGENQEITLTVDNKEYKGKTVDEVVTKYKESNKTTSDEGIAEQDDAAGTAGSEGTAGAAETAGTAKAEGTAGTKTPASVKATATTEPEILTQNKAKEKIKKAGIDDQKIEIKDNKLTYTDKFGDKHRNVDLTEDSLNEAIELCKPKHEITDKKWVLEKDNGASSDAILTSNANKKYEIVDIADDRININFITAKESTLKTNANIKAIQEIKQNEWKDKDIGKPIPALRDRENNIWVNKDNNWIPLEQFLNEDSEGEA